MTIAVAISFDTGVLLCADTKYGVPFWTHPDPTRIFSKRYGSNPGYAHSIFLISEPVDCTLALVQHCERVLEVLQPRDHTIDRMKSTIEGSLLEVYEKHLDWPDSALLIALYSPSDQQCSLFHTGGTALTEVAGYDCEGDAAYLGHYLIRDRYKAAQSMESLDLTTVFSIAIETVDTVRVRHGRCGESTEIIVMYANGSVSDVQRMGKDARKLRKLAHSAGLSGA